MCPQDSSHCPWSLPPRQLWASVPACWPSGSRSTPRMLPEQQNRTWWHPRGSAGGPEAGSVSPEPLCPQIAFISVRQDIAFQMFAACNPLNQTGCCAVGSSQDFECPRPPLHGRMSPLTSEVSCQLALHPRPGRASLSPPSPSNASSSSARTSLGE